jgi:hypothetical protein
LHLLKQSPRLSPSIAATEADSQSAELDVLEHTQVRKDPRSLKRSYETHAGQAFWGTIRYLTLFEKYPTFGKPLEAANGVDEGRLASAIGPNQPEDLGALQDEIDAVDCPNSAVVNRQLLGTKCHLAILTPISSC